MLLESSMTDVKGSNEGGVLHDLDWLKRFESMSQQDQLEQLKNPEVLREMQEYHSHTPNLRKAFFPKAFPILDKPYSHLYDLTYDVAKGRVNLKTKGARNEYGCA